MTGDPARSPAHRGRRGVGLVVTVLAAVAGLVLVGLALTGQRSTPVAAAAVAGRVAAVPGDGAVAGPARPMPAAQSPPDPSSPAQPSGGQPPTAPAPTRSTPTRLTIPAISVDSALVPLGRNADQTIEVPASFGLAGWYTGSVTAGEVGPMVVLGHVDSDRGPGVFFRLGALRPGDVVTASRTDGRTVNYRITGVREYPKAQFPTLDVYADTQVPALRLITCGGRFDAGSGHYESNIIAYGEQLVG